MGLTVTVFTPLIHENLARLRDITRFRYGLQGVVAVAAEFFLLILQYSGQKEQSNEAQNSH